MSNETFAQLQASGAWPMWPIGSSVSASISKEPKGQRAGLRVALNGKTEAKSLFNESVFSPNSVYTMGFLREEFRPV